jgi:hypothetical protein
VKLAERVPVNQAAFLVREEDAGGGLEVVRVGRHTQYLADADICVKVFLSLRHEPASTRL